MDRLIKCEWYIHYVDVVLAEGVNDIYNLYMILFLDQQENKLKILYIGKSDKPPTHRLMDQKHKTFLKILQDYQNKYSHLFGEAKRVVLAIGKTDNKLKSDVEALLIYTFQPEYNTHHRGKPPKSKINLEMKAQNYPQYIVNYCDDDFQRIFNNKIIHPSNEQQRLTETWD